VTSREEEGTPLLSHGNFFPLNRNKTAPAFPSPFTTPCPLAEIHEAPFHQRPSQEARVLLNPNSLRGLSLFSMRLAPLPPVGPKNFFSRIWTSSEGEQPSLPSRFSFSLLPADSGAFFLSSLFFARGLDFPALREKDPRPILFLPPLQLGDLLSLSFPSPGT